MDDRSLTRQIIEGIGNGLDYGLVPFGTVFVFVVMWFSGCR